MGGQHDVLVRLARCCSPIPGDEVVGYVTRGRGVTIHAADCEKAFGLDPARRIDVEWDPDGSPPRPVRLRVLSVDRPGLLAKVTKCISAAGVNIERADVRTSEDETAVQTFDLLVPDADTLAAVMREVQRTRGVLSVERVRS